MNKYTGSQPKKPRQLPLVITADFLIFALSLSVFCYFHHIRSLWGLGGNDMIATETASSADDDSALVSADLNIENTTSDDFSVSFPRVFTDNGNSVMLENDTEIRAYMSENGLEFTDLQDCNSDDYIGLYRSEDIYMTAEKINTDIYYNEKTYNVTYYLYDVYVRNIENLFTVAVDEREPITDLALTSHEINGAGGDTFVTSPAILALNGDYLGNENHAYFAVRNGDIVRDSDYIGADICVLYADGTMETITIREFDRGELMAKNPYQVWEFGPSLLDVEGHALYDFNEAFYDENVLTSRHPRSSIGYYEPGHYCFIVVDGRSEESDGVRLFQLGEIYESLGCKVAYNFDGGDSAQSLWNGIEHRTDEDRRLEGEDQRKLYDIVCIGEVKEK